MAPTCCKFMGCGCYMKSDPQLIVYNTGCVFCCCIDCCPGTEIAMVYGRNRAFPCCCRS
jgi:hypothetical protein